MEMAMQMPPEPKEKQEMLWDYCPSCAGELDTGFECDKCGRDWRPWATLRIGVTESETTQ